MNKTHISLDVRNLDAALAFYRNFLQAEPAKVRPGYANFELDNPPLKLALNQANEGSVSHLGVQVADREAVFQSIERLQAAGLETLVETDTDCCHAVQDKVWIADPDGHRWEVFVVKGDAHNPEAEPCDCSCSA
ncbi:MULTISPECIES: ArsI/CadI family heavy metal resistance metalloenzyme [unclassified Wenzhouxiangella]|uniref:ArsI/CadI family heavy metal resistance metalloenzyme n=1 Tax=unclassified Wenzhouxiangella TaxID=2613841 RepID=UPI000E32AE26|nr:MULTISPECIES: ArsI/CadI family heavy metal resistance metalloenzyme [unclassified Wenzhouxiangella]RFF29007.1 glyoxalase/bleomycin resistance/dioxygenase family protein [Wenzhouxiangella sp. 15181]RFP68287.1 glyoxalase/bleomycin resistance/dioxygenase family protein [Wenzhouxiangella sp. 15190]